MDSDEILWMNRLLEVEALSFKLQLKDAVSNLVHLQFLIIYLIIYNDFHSGTRESFYNYFFALQGFTDTSLTVGEAAAVLTNYERRTGETLSRSDLQNQNLAAKLKPEDYDLKGQVLLHLQILIPLFPTRSHLYCW